MTRLLLLFATYFNLTVAAWGLAMGRFAEAAMSAFFALLPWLFFPWDDLRVKLRLLARRAFRHAPARPGRRSGSGRHRW
jgi:hypothetical protein